MTDIVERLLHLVSLDDPERGGPYGGAAAQACMGAMREAASEIERLRGALAPFARHLGMDGAPVVLRIGADTWLATLTTEDFTRARHALGRRS